MPVYEYLCSDCGSKFEKFLKFSSSDADLRCPCCNGGGLRKLFSTFATSISNSPSSTSYSPPAGYSPAGPV